MITSTSRRVGSGGNPRKANIEQQIRRLEKKKKQLLKKLNGEADDSGSSENNLSTALAQASVVIHQQAGGAQPAAVSSEEGAASLPVTANASASAGSAQNVGQTLNELMASLSSGGGEGSLDIQEDPEEILKQIQLVDMQIIMLRQQLGEDNILSLAAEQENGGDAEGLFKEAVAKLQASAMKLPTAEVTGGHVDGYA